MLRTKVGGKKFNKLTVRLKRKGCIRYPLYEVVLMKEDSRRDGFIVERLGFFNPHFDSRLFIIDSKRLAHWLNKGAVVHATVKKYIAKFLV